MPTGDKPDTTSENPSPPKKSPKASPARKVAHTATKPSARSPTRGRSGALPTKSASKKPMGSLLSSTGGRGKPASTASGSSAHTASTVPADSDTHAKSQTLPARPSGTKPRVPSFLRRKPGQKSADAAGESAGSRPARRSSDPPTSSSETASARKPARRSYTSTLKSSLFRKSNSKAKESSGSDSQRTSSSPEKGRPPSGSSGSRSPEKARAASGTTPPKAPRTSAQADSTVRRKTPSPSEASARKKTPSPSDASARRKTPSPSPAVEPPPPATGAGARTKPSSPVGRGRASQALTPAKKEELKKQWFTESQPKEPVPGTRRTGRQTVESRPGGRTAAIRETVGPPVRASRVAGSVLSSQTNKPRAVSPKKQPGARTAGTKGTKDDGLDDIMVAMEGFGSGVDRKSEKGSPSPEKEHITEKKADTAAGDGLLDLMGAMEGFRPDGSKRVDGTKSGEDKKMETDNVKAGSLDDDQDMKEAGDALKKSAADRIQDEDVGVDGGLVSSTTWRHGDEDTGELGLGGISMKDRETRAKMPSPQKPAAADLDFLTGLIETSSPAAAKQPQKERKDQVQTGGKDSGLADLMDITKDFNMGKQAKSESDSESKPHVPDEHLDKFLDSMDMDAFKPAPSMPKGEEVTETVGAVKTWRTGDGDEEEMAELKNKPRDRDAPSQPPAWDIDDLITDQSVKQASTDPEKKKSGAGKGEDLSAFDNLLSGLLGGGDIKSKTDKDDNSVAPEPPTGGADLSVFDDFLSIKNVEDKSRDDDKGAEPSAPPLSVGDTDFSTFDDFLSGKDSGSKAQAKDKKPSAPPGGKGFSAFDDFLSSEVPESKPEGDSKPSVPKAPAGEADFSAFDDFLLKEAPAKESASKTTVSPTLAEPAAVMKTSSGNLGSAPRTERAEEEIVASTAFTSDAATKPTGKSTPASDKHMKKLGDTTGSVPDHGHGVRGLLYDEMDKTGRRSPSPAKKNKPREPAVLEDIIQPAMAPKSSSAPAAHRPEELVVAETASLAEASSKPHSKKPTEKHLEKLGDTRGSVPDHGHGVRDLLYDEKDKTGRRSPSPAKKDKHREPVVLEDIIQPAKASKSSTTPGTHNTEELMATKTASSTEASAKPQQPKKATEKCMEKLGDTRGSVPDYGHGVRDLLYDEKDKTGRRSPSAAKKDKHRETAALEDVIQPVKASGSSTAPGTHSTEELIATEIVSSTEASAKPQKPKKSTGKHVEKLGDTRGSVPDHGHGVRDLLYDEKDETGRRPPSPARTDRPDSVEVLDDIIRPRQAVSVSAAPPPRATYTAETAERSRRSRTPSPSETETLERYIDLCTSQGTEHSVPPPATGQAAEHSVPPAPTATAVHQKRAHTHKSLSLAGLSDPDRDDDDGEELRKLIASTEALERQLHSLSHKINKESDGKEVRSVLDLEVGETERELELVERAVERQERHLDSKDPAAAATQTQRSELQAARQNLEKVKQELATSRQKGEAKLKDLAK